MADEIRKGRLIENNEEFWEHGEIGDWSFTEGETHIFLKEPPGGEIAALPIRGRFQTEYATWEWDGNREAPTLSPSILSRTTGWHGYMRAGQLESV